MLLEWAYRTDLSTLQTIAALFGMVLCVYAAQATWLDVESSRDCWPIRYGRKVMYPVLGLTFLWGVDYSVDSGMTPWPPTVAMIIAMDFIIAMRIAALRGRQKAIERRGWERPQGIDLGARDF